MGGTRRVPFLPSHPVLTYLAGNSATIPPEVSKISQQAEETERNQKQGLFFYQIPNPCSSQWMKGKSSPT